MNTIDLASVRSRLSERGFAGPLPLSAGVDVVAIADRLESMWRDASPHPIYGRFSTRDWHLVDPALCALLQDSAVLRCLAIALGQDLSLWRSKLFAKPPNAGWIGWHQEWGSFNGEEIGNDRPALVPPPSEHDEPWNLSVWIPLCDVDERNGCLRFAAGTHRHRFPVEMVPLSEAEFWEQPFAAVTSVRELVERARANALVVDIDTRNIFDEVDAGRLTFAEACDHVRRALHCCTGTRTRGFDPAEHEVESIPAPVGTFVLFSERTMHASGPNCSDNLRLAITARYTQTSTLVYPFKHSANPLDGSNLDVRGHRVISIRTGRKHLGSVL